MGNNGSVTTSPRSRRDVVNPPQTTNLADLLERVLDKGVVIAGDITLFLGGVELLTLRIRLLVASIDKAQEIGINWWQFDPALSLRASGRAKELEQSEKERNLLQERLDRLERMLLAPPQEADQKHSEAGRRSNAAAAYVLDPEGRMIAELKQLAQRALQPQEVEQPRARQLAEWPQEVEQPRAPQRAPQPEAVQVEQPAGGGPLRGQDLPERIAQAMQHVLEEVRQPNRRAPQPVAQAWPTGQRGAEQPPEAEQPHVQEPEAEQNAASACVFDVTSAYVLDKEGRMIAELTPRAQQPPEEERPQAPERAEQPRAEETEQPVGGRPLVGQALHEHIAQAIQPVLGVVLAVHLGIAQAPQADEQDAAPAAVLDQEGRVIATLTPAQPLQEDEVLPLATDKRGTLR
jgi:hypothetical protein